MSDFNNLPPKPNINFENPTSGVDNKQENKPATTSNSNGHQNIIIAVLVVALVGLGGYLLYNNSSSNKTTSGNYSSSNVNNTSKRNQISYYVSRMNQHNNTITNCAVEINKHISAYGNLRNASHLLSQCRNVRRSISDDRNNFVSDYGRYNDRYYYLLRELFDLELTRIDGLVNGIDHGVVGGNYTRYFQEGTAAAYRFDDVEKEFNRTPRP